MKKKIINSILVVMFFITNIGVMWAVPIPAPSGMPPNPFGGDNDPAAPIDSALIWLLLLGIVFGVYMVAKKNRKSKSIVVV